jgi:hypothetical protein
MPIVRTPLTAGDGDGEGAAAGEATGPGELAPVELGRGELVAGALAGGELAGGDAVPAGTAGAWADGLAPEDAVVLAGWHEDAASAAATSGMTTTADVG